MPRPGGHGRHSRVLRDACARTDAARLYRRGRNDRRLSRRVSVGDTRAGCRFPESGKRPTLRIGLVRVLLDECVDWRLSREIVGHEVKTARQMGWTAIKNGELLALASQSFDAFVTVDQNLSFQRNLGAWPIAVIVLRGRTNRLADLVPLVPRLSTALRAVKPGTVQVVDGSVDPASEGFTRGQPDDRDHQHRRPAAARRAGALGVFRATHIGPAGHLPARIGSAQRAAYVLAVPRSGRDRNRASSMTV